VGDGAGAANRRLAVDAELGRENSAEQIGITAMEDPIEERDKRKRLER